MTLQYESDWFGSTHIDPIEAFTNPNPITYTPNVGVKPGGGSSGAGGGSRVTEALMKPGGWSVRLREETPVEILRAIDWTVTPTAGFGHIFIFNAPVVPTEYADANLKSMAVYAGILREAPDARTIGGPGMIAWLGDETDKGAILETAITNTAANLATWITSIRPASLSAGTVTSPGGSYTGTFQWITPRQALDAVCAALGTEYRVNPAGTLDAAIAATLFGTTPTGFVTRRSEGREDYLGILASQLEQARDLDDYTTKIRTIAKTALGTASGAATPYKDINGNSVVWTRVVETPESDDANAAATALINLFSTTRKAVRLSSSTFAIPSTIEVGASVYVFDPRSGLVDTANQIYYAGETLYPVALRVYAYTWPIREGMGVAFRDGDGNWTDLTPWVQWDTGDTTIDVGGYPRTLNGDPSYAGSAANYPAVNEGGWTFYGTTWSGTIGNGTLTAWFRRNGSTVTGRIKLTWGSTTSHGGATQTFTLPLTPHADYTINFPVGTAVAHDSGVQAYTGTALIVSGSTICVFRDSNNTPVSNTAPMTFGTNDEVLIEFEYQSALT